MVVYDGLIVGEVELPLEEFSGQEQRHPELVVRPHVLPNKNEQRQHFHHSD